MQCGMFGKLPSKRDFVSYNMPRPFLDHWEMWLQTTMAASKLTLGSKWQEIFLKMPIWRFWFGSNVFGQATTGALMPSVDGIGRYFPLSVCAFAFKGTNLTPPPLKELDLWHATCEQFLLQMLEDQLEAEPAALLETLAFAPAETHEIRPPENGRLLRWSSDSGSLDVSFKSLQMLNNEAIHGAKSYWWTSGGADHKAQLVALNGRANDQFLYSMMTGNFD
jgi:type VI secretion system protein ImpM